MNASQFKVLKSDVNQLRVRGLSAQVNTLKHTLSSFGTP